ncbi:MAG: GNAT family N-acetyltransferase [Candidatus Kariarchaeaceae archaeon]|jgi:GNAT superfamily N-acetyltransferase
MSIISRTYVIDNDFEQIREFLIETFNLTKTLTNWLPDRFENSHDDKPDDICIWEEEKSSRRKIVALCNLEGNLDYYIQIHPQYQYLEHEIIQWIEEHQLKKNLEDPRVRIHCIAGDEARESLLLELGYKKLGCDNINRIRPLEMPLPVSELPHGFTFRNLDGRSDFIKYAESIKLVFGHSFFTPEIVETNTKRSYYVQDLDLVIVAPDGTFAAFATFRMDPVSRLTNLEPLGTHPDYRKLGLGKALLFELLSRVQKYNPTLLYIGGAANTPAANRLYDVTGYTQKLEDNVWEKVL